MSTSDVKKIETAGVRDAVRLASFLDELEALIEEIQIEHGLCHWGLYTGKPSGDLNEIERRRAAVLLDPDYGAVATDWRERTGDPTLERRLVVLGRLIDDAKIRSSEDVFTLRNSINERIVGFRHEIGGREVSVRGRISMDQTIIDLSDVSDARIGQEVEIISTDPQAANSVDGISRLLGTIPQEVTTALGHRIARIAVE